MQIAGHTALVTGASGGVGGAIARRLAQEGARLIVTGRRERELADVAAAYDARVVVADLATPEGLTAVAEASQDADIAVHNAALPGGGKLTDFDDDDLERALAVNLHAPIALSRDLVGAMTARGQGHLVMISSISGKIGMADMSIYSATKFGLRGFAQALRAELAGTGIGVSTLTLGPVSDSGMFADSGLKAPRLFGTSPPEAVAGAVVRAIQKNVAEITVAPLPVKVLRPGGGRRARAAAVGDEAHRHGGVLAGAGRGHRGQALSRAG